jgi:hypothetical protein
MTLPDRRTFDSGETGEVTGIRRRARATAGDLLLDLRQRALRTGATLDRLAERTPRRSVLALCIYRPGRERAVALASELARSRHDVRLAFGALGARDPRLADETVVGSLAGGKFENLNAVWSASGADGAVPDWVVVADDDVALPPRFLDRFLGLCEHFELDLAQPAQTLRSHAAWRVTRRRGGSLVRETRYVEIGPVTAFSREVAETLIPFPALRFGWGLDLHWGALARERDWRLGVVDAVPVRHDMAPVATDYPRAEAVREEQQFLATRPYLDAAEAQETLRVHRRITA